MTIGTRLFTWWKGELVGTDQFGNRYYREKGGRPRVRGGGRASRERRWVIYNGEAEASRVPPEWHAWLHHSVDAPPQPEQWPHYPWQKEHVPISGIKVGTIVSETLDPTNFLAVVKLTVDPMIKVPSDTVAEILSSGLLGDKYLALVPGAADDTIPPGGEIKFTQSPMSLENLIGQYIFSQGQSKKSEGDGDKGQAPPGAQPKKGNADADKPK